MEARRKRGRQIEDLELAAYAEEVGHEKYHKEYSRLLWQGKYQKKSYHGRKDHKSKAELEAIKRKYQNGVTKDQINAMLGIKGEEA